MDHQNELTVEYVVWGLKPEDRGKGACYEDLLYTGLETRQQADRIVKILREHGCTNLKIRRIDLRTKPNFAKTIGV